MAGEKSIASATKRLCIIAMLIALTVVLSWISGYLRIGTFMKFSISFISVYMAACIYGPLAGGFVGAVSDIISCVVMPVGALIVPLTIVEFFYGILFGLLFYRGKMLVNNVYIRVFLCTFIRLAADVFLKTEILSEYGFVPGNYSAALMTRLPGCAVMAVLMFVILLISEKTYTDKLIKLAKI